MPVSFEFDADKAIAAVVYLASKPIEGLTKYKICKLVFLADKYHLVRFGRPITGDRLCAMPYGPVPSRILNILNSVITAEEGLRNADQEGRRLSEFVEVQRMYHDPHFRAVRDIEAGILSASDTGALDAVVHVHGAKTFGELKAMTHELYAYQKARADRPNNSPPIAYEDLFEEDDDALEGAREEMIENHQLRTAFGNAGI